MSINKTSRYDNNPFVRIARFSLAKESMSTNILQCSKFCLGLCVRFAVCHFFLKVFKIDVLFDDSYSLD